MPPGIYLSRGYIDPGLAMQWMPGVLAGSLTGARVLAGAKVQVLRVVRVAGRPMFLHGRTQGRP